MSEEFGNAKDASDGARLWARARPGWRAFASPGEALGVSGEAPDPLILAAYLDGTLDLAERERVEAWMAAFPEALELMAAARQTLETACSPGCAAWPGRKTRPGAPWPGPA